MNVDTTLDRPWQPLLDWRWERACSVIHADLAVDADSGPAWARS
jgi:hypothetical protein